MIITLIGMSGTGKSYWSKRLKRIGYLRFGCDDLITELIAQKIGLTDGTSFNMHEWVGYPDEKTYPVRAELYRQVEAEIMSGILDYLRKNKDEENIVIDTTGSVIYLSALLLAELKQRTKIIYLDITQEDFDAMLKHYLENPAAIIWNNFFKPFNGETRQETFARCYPKLIRSREIGYKDLQHLSIPPAFHRAKDIKESDFLEYVQEHLAE